MKNKILKLVGLVLFTLLLVACGNNGEQKENENKTAKEENDNKVVENEITLTDLQGNPIVLQKRPERIVSLIAGDLNTLYDLGAEAVGRPVIRGEMSEAIAKLPEVGTSNDVNNEKIAGLQPDVVIAHPQLNKDAIPALEELGIAVIQMGANSVDSVKQSIEILGKLVQKEEEASKLIEEIEEQSNQTLLEGAEQLRTLIIFGSAGNWMVALPTSLSGGMLEVVGGHNIAKDYEKLERFPQYAQLEMEKIIEADPEVIFFITAGPYEETVNAFLSEMEKNPAWHAIHAIKNDQFIGLPNHLFGANPGSRITESLDFLKNELERIQKNK